MTNEEIILKSVQAHLTPAQRHEIAAAAYTPEQIAHAVEHIPDGLDELAASQVHTFAWWKDNGKSVKRGEKALFTCPLWKYTDKPSNAQIKAAEAAGKEVQPAVHYYPTTSYMFSCLQVESSKPAPAGRFKSIDEIKAYNKMLAEQRRAARVSAAIKITLHNNPQNYIELNPGFFPCGVGQFKQIMKLVREDTAHTDELTAAIIDILKCKASTCGPDQAAARRNLVALGEIKEEKSPVKVSNKPEFFETLMRNGSGNFRRLRSGYRAEYAGFTFFFSKCKDFKRWDIYESRCGLLALPAGKCGRTKAECASCLVKYFDVEKAKTLNLDKMEQIKKAAPLEAAASI